MGSILSFALLLVWNALASPGTLAAYGRAPSPASDASPPPQATAAPVAAPAANPGPASQVIVELFTSQGCSSCPPADRLLTKIGKDSAGRVVPLAFHVDFWNHGGWKDPFSSHDWTERQVVYARTLGLRQVYTPQAIVDGRVEMVGSDEQRLRSSISADAARPAAGITLRLEPAESKIAVTAEIDRPDSLRGRKLDLMMAVFETGLSTQVARGENGGSTLQDDYVVRSLRRVSTLSSGGPARTEQRATLSLEKDWKRAGLGVAAFLQDPKSLEVFGARAQALAAGQAAAR